jgi:uncharacterized protein (DUF302 family)
MMSATKLSNSSVTRITLQTTTSYSEVVEAIYADIGHAPVSLPELTAQSESWEEYEKATTQKLGPSGFMLFGSFDHGAWVKKAGLNQAAVRIILGNPLIAITLLRHDIAAGLFVPVELLVVEESVGTSVTYLRPSTLLDAPSAPLLQAARALDAKLDAFVQKVVESEG